MRRKSSKPLADGAHAALARTFLKRSVRMLDDNSAIMEDRRLTDDPKLLAQLLRRYDVGLTR